MTPTEFCYWLQGCFELANPQELTAKQTDLIKRHLNLVFFHAIDPSYSDDPEVLSQMQDIHDGDDPSIIDGPGVPPDHNPLTVSPPFPPTHPYGPPGGPMFKC